MSSEANQLLIKNAITAVKRDSNGCLQGRLVRWIVWKIVSSRRVALRLPGTGFCCFRMSGIIRPAQNLMGRASAFSPSASSQCRAAIASHGIFNRQDHRNTRQVQRPAEG